MTIQQNMKPKVWQIIGETITKCKSSAEAIQEAALEFEVLKRPNIHPPAQRPECDISKQLFHFPNVHGGCFRQ